ncbi:MAG TPA: hypothetical protein DIU07_07420, partial [Rhodobacteraceae bacterium]|nr:hypothetical protein [Paracoccaceae bacterium]
GDQIKAAALRAHAALEWVEDTLCKASFLAGQTLSAVDIAYMPIMQGLVRAGKRDDAINLGPGFDAMTAKYPAIARWLGRIEALREYDKAYPLHWLDSLPPLHADTGARATKGHSVREPCIRPNARQRAPMAA